jgi:hypothetical protein
LHNAGSSRIRAIAAKEMALLRAMRLRIITALSRRSP